MCTLCNVHSSVRAVVKPSALAKVIWKCVIYTDGNVFCTRIVFYSVGGFRHKLVPTYFVLKKSNMSYRPKEILTFLTSGFGYM